MSEVRQDLAVAEYETLGGKISITLNDIKEYLAKGTSTLTDKEAILFLQLCKSQRLNPWTGEAYPIKFGNDFQMVVGYETYKRRAEDNPEYIGRKSGIVVLRGKEIIQKEGTCLYPGESLIGGWCRVYRLKRNEKEETFKEVALSEYQKMKDGKPSANWASKPCTMIEKVAVSQALRAAFPKDFEGMYTESEMGTPEVSMIADSGEASEKPVIKVNEDGEIIEGDFEEPEDDGKDKLVSHGDRVRLLDFAKSIYGDSSVEKIQGICAECGVESLRGMRVYQFEMVVDAFNEMLQNDGIAETFTI